MTPIEPLQNGHVPFIWDAPPCGHRHGHITGYEYEFETDGKYDQNTSSNTTEVSNLDINEIRRFRVRAFTVVGPGPYSEFLTVYIFGSGALPSTGKEY